MTNPPSFLVFFLALVLVGFLAHEGRAEDDAVLDGAGGATDGLEVLPEVRVTPPRIYATPSEAARPEVATTPLRREALVFDVPAAVTVQDGDYIRRRRMARNTTDALLRLPGVMVQKTAPLQSSPYIRGFTGYRNLLLIDGIRLNNSAFRDGPNQYWSTVDAYTIGRLELTRGPLSVLYGSDAVGGVVNVVPQRRESFEPGWHLDGLYAMRAASAESSVFQRFQAEGNYGTVGFLGGVTWREMGDVVSGGGRLPGTGDIREIDGDLRFDIPLDRHWRLVAAYQHVGQEDAPRTHSTVDSKPWHGTVAGTDLRREYDQQRDLAYARVEFDSPCGVIAGGRLGMSLHRHWEQRDRLRTRGRGDLSGFELHQYGVQYEMENRSPIGSWTWGVDYYHDESDTWRHNTVDGVPTGSDVQGPFGDDGRYDLLGVYAQDDIDLGRLDLILGGRFTYASAHAGRVEDPLTGGVIAVGDDWTNFAGSVRGVYAFSECWNAYAGLSQAFRAPTLYDLTAYDATSVFELPSPGLQPEQYLTAELGTKTQQQDVSGYASVWYTWIRDGIVRSPTGEVVDDTPVVRKDNVGDGWVWGWEAELAWRMRPAWVVYGNVSWLEGKQDQIDEASARIVRTWISRHKPLTSLLGLRYEPPGGCGWLQFEWAYSLREDRLSLRDSTDRTRIPPGGTPGWSTLSVRGGVRVGRQIHLGVALENLLDEDYRIHGSGQNEAGFNFVATLDVEM